MDIAQIETRTSDLVAVAFNNYEDVPPKFLKKDDPVDRSDFYKNIHEATLFTDPSTAMRATLTILDHGGFENCNIDESDWFIRNNLYLYHVKKTRQFHYTIGGRV